MVVRSYLNRLVGIKSSCLLLQLLDIKAITGQVHVNNWCWESWINSNGRKLVNFLFGADWRLVHAVNRANPKYTFIVRRKLAEGALYILRLL